MVDGIIHDNKTKMNKSPNSITSIPRDLQKAKLAFYDENFIESKMGRPVRILSEYLYPYDHFKKEGIDKTIVFFGSARSISSAEYNKRAKELEKLIEMTPDSQKESLLREKKKLNSLKAMTKYFDDAVELSNMVSLWSKELPEESKVVVCTGGGPGIMQAANKGAYYADAPNIGLNITLPFEQKPNPYITPKLNFEFHYFMMRKYWFVHYAEAVIIFPGGYGTMDELFELLTLVQTGIVDKPLTIILYGKKFWDKVVNFEYLAEVGMISIEDLALFNYADTPEAAFETIRLGLQKSEMTKAEATTDNSVE
jgi:uncharacterized protein (TIGR00730 family)